MGKPVAEALAEVDKCARNCDYYADAAPAMLADAPVAGLPGTFLAYEPIGVVLAIMPWNYPLWQVVRFLAPTLAARSEEHTSELQSLMRISYAVFCLKKKNNNQPLYNTNK